MEVDEEDPPLPDCGMPTPTEEDPMEDEEVAQPLQLHLCNYGVLGRRLRRHDHQITQITTEPNMTMAIMDPTSLHHIQSGPRGAGGAFFARRARV